MRLSIRMGLAIVLLGALSVPITAGEPTRPAPAMIVDDKKDKLPEITLKDHPDKNPLHRLVSFDFEHIRMKDACRALSAAAGIEIACEEALAETDVHLVMCDYPLISSLWWLATVTDCGCGAINRDRSGPPKITGFAFAKSLPQTPAPEITKESREAIARLCSKYGPNQVADFGNSPAESYMKPLLTMVLANLSGQLGNIAFSSKSAALQRKNVPPPPFKTDVPIKKILGHVLDQSGLKFEFVEGVWYVSGKDEPAFGKDARDLYPGIWPGISARNGMLHPEKAKAQPPQESGRK